MMKVLALENMYKIVVTLFGTANAEANKGTTILC